MLAVLVVLLGFLVVAQVALVVQVVVEMVKIKMVVICHQVL
jgi:hypothetical protein